MREQIESRLSPVDIRSQTRAAARSARVPSRTSPRQNGAVSSTPTSPRPS
jgi:hypothetical protein